MVIRQIKSFKLNLQLINFSLSGIFFFMESFNICFIRISFLIGFIFFFLLCGKTTIYLLIGICFMNPDKFYGVELKPNFNV